MIIVGVTGGIAAFKTCQLVSNLVKKYDVHVLMTKNATNFINPITFETLTSHKCIIDTFDRNFDFKVEHVELAKACDVFVVAPASADIIAKLAYGICDDMLTTTFMASKAKKIIVPAMNTNMYENPILQDNLKKLQSYGITIMDSATGLLACKDIGKGKMIDIDLIEEEIEIALTKDKYLFGKKVMISAGPTQETIDPVRYITNHSSGKMGYALAKAAIRHGAKVTLVSGKVDLKAPLHANVINVVSAKDMYEAIMQNADEQDIIIKSAAVADYTPINTASSKLKKSDDDLKIDLKRTDDILLSLGKAKKANQVICGFAMETEDLVENAKAKLIKKNADMIIANNLNTEGAGFKGDTNVVTIIKADEIIEKELMSKDALADDILMEAYRILESKGDIKIC